jgi:acyl dehydratase
MSAAEPGPLARRTGTDNWFEDFTVGRRLRHARGATVGEVENQTLTKLVMNTAQAHWNEHAMQGSAFGRDGRVVFGLVTGSIVIGMTSQDTAENALAELGLDKLRFRSPVFHEDTLYAWTEVLDAAPAPDRDDAGVVTFRHWGTNQDGTVVFEGERRVLVKRRSHWGGR